MNVWKSLPAAKQHLAVLHYECISRAKEVSESMGIPITDDVASLATETAFRFAQLLVADLEAFAGHAKRSTITVDDIRLFVRRNPSLCKFIEKKSAEMDSPIETSDMMNSEPLAPSSVAKKSKKTQQKIENSISTPKPKPTNADQTNDSGSALPNQPTMLSTSLFDDEEDFSDIFKGIEDLG